MSDITNLDATDPHEVGEAISNYADVVARRGNYEMAGNLIAAYEWIQELDQRDYIQALESAVDEALDVIDQLVEFGGILSDENDESIAKIKEVRKK